MWTFRWREEKKVTTKNQPIKKIPVLLLLLLLLGKSSSILNESPCVLFCLIFSSLEKISARDNLQSDWILQDGKNKEFHPSYSIFYRQSSSVKREWLRGKKQTKKKTDLNAAQECCVHSIEYLPEFIIRSNLIIGVPAGSYLIRLMDNNLPERRRISWALPFCLAFTW